MITTEVIQQTLEEAEKEVLQELKIYSKQILFQVLGIDIDSWGHVSKITSELKTEILNLKTTQIIKTELFEIIDNSLKTSIVRNIENEFLKKDVIKNIIDSVTYNLQYSFKKELEEQVKAAYDDLLIKYKNEITASINAMPFLQYNMIKTL